MLGSADEFSSLEQGLDLVSISLPDGPERSTK